MGLGYGSPFSRLKIDLVNSLGSTWIRGRMFSFGNDLRCGPSALKDEFNCIYSIANFKVGLVEDFYDSRGEGACNVTLRRNLNE